MRQSLYLRSTLSAAFAISLTIASPVSSVDSFLSSRQLNVQPLVNCTDLTSAFDSSCWKTLDLSNYLNNATTGWNKTTSICDITHDSSRCCIAGEPWTTCFLRLAHGTGGSDCSEINVQTCSLDMHQTVTADMAPQVHYVMKTIYSINDFFTTYWTALQYAASQAQLVIQPLINELDRKETTVFNIFNILSVLAVGLAFLGAPSIAVGTLALESSISYASQSLLISMQQTPGLTKALWPTGTEDSKSIQVGALDTFLGNATQQMADMMNRGVQLLMSDMPSFVTFAESGRFSGRETMSLPQKTAGLDFALSTYMLSEAMAQNGWYITPYRGTYTRDQAGQGPEGCTMDDNNVCTIYDLVTYWSSSTGRIYNLNNGRGNHVTPYKLVQAIVANGWASLEVLFDGAFNCTAVGKAGSAAINFNWDGTLDVSCVSQVPVNIGCGGVCPVPFIKGECPFKVVPIISRCDYPTLPPP